LLQELLLQISYNDRSETTALSDFGELESMKQNQNSRPSDMVSVRGRRRGRGESAPAGRRIIEAQEAGPPRRGRPCADAGGLPAIKWLMLASRLPAMSRHTRALAMALQQTKTIGGSKWHVSHTPRLQLIRPVAAHHPTPPRDK